MHFEKSRDKWSIVLLLLMFGSSCRAEITIKDNGYRGILIAIHDSVDEDSNLLEGIREAFTEASEFLHNVTL